MKFDLNRDQAGIPGHLLVRSYALTISSGLNILTCEVGLHSASVPGVIDEQLSILCPDGYGQLHLRETAIDEQFNAGDVAGVVRCQKHDCLRDFFRSPKSAERDRG